MTVADSDVLVDFLRGREPAASTVANLLGAGALETTAVNVAELAQGVRSSKQGDALRGLLDVVQVLALDRSAAMRAGTIRRQLVAAGKDIGLADCAIAAICLERGSPLLTGNRDHFSRIDGLELRALRASGVDAP